MLIEKIKKLGLDMGKIISNNIPAVVLLGISIVGIVWDWINRFWENNPISVFFLKGFNSLLGNLSYSLLAGAIIWFVFSYSYDRKRKNIVKKRLSASYNSFKKRVIEILIQASEEYPDYEFIKKLSHYENFRNYFEEDNDRRRRFIEGQLAHPDYSYRHDLMVEFGSFEKEISNMLNANILSDENTNNYFHYVSDAITRRKLEYKAILSDNDSSFYSFDKYFMGAIWVFLARRSDLTGHVKEGMEQMIEKI